MTYSSRHYGAGDPACPICKGIGYISYNVDEGHPHFGKIFDCDCRSDSVHNERNAYLRRVGGLEHLADKTFATFTPDRVGLHERHLLNLHSAYQRAVGYADSPDGWLVITGTFGCGKTHLAAAIANARIEQGGRVMFVTAPDLLDYLRSAFSPGQSLDEGYNARFDEVRTIPMLVLDDLGIESPTPWATEKLYQIINYRYNAQLPTVITTNHKIEDMEQRLRSRLSDIDIAERIAITAPDYRQGSGYGELGSLNGINLYRHMTFDSFEIRRDITREQQDNLQKAVHYARNYASDPEGWIVFLGEYSSGKTHLAAAIANAFEAEGNEALFITVPDLLDHLRATFAPTSQVSYDKRFNQIKSTRLLVLDDLGTESATPWAREKLYQLINHRYNAHLPTVITTSHKLEEIDPRLVTRMRDKRLCQLFAILAPAYLGNR